MQKLGTMEVPSCFPRSFPAQGDKENIEGKDVSGIQTEHQKHLNKGKVIQHLNDQESDFPSSVELPWKYLLTRRFPHPDSPNNGVERPSLQSWSSHLEQQEMHGEKHSTGDPKC